MDRELAQYLKERGKLVDSILEDLLPPASTYPPIIYEAMRYSVFAGGKRLRPILCLAGAEALAKDYTPLLPVAGAIELIHTYSLIHDDLPGMDNDDFRRGKPTNHRQFGEGIAILAGDGLLTMAFEILSRYGLEQIAEKGFSGQQYLQAIHEISRAAGVAGMIGGQVLDLQEAGQEANEEAKEEAKEKAKEDVLQYIHQHKTGALFRASIRVGAILSNASETELAALTAYSEYFGLAFQITDDILDITGDKDKLGKPVGSDTKNQKITYPAIYGLEGARVLAEEAVEKASGSLSNLPGNIQPLVKLVNYLLERES